MSSLLDIPWSTVSGVIGKWKHLETEASPKVEDDVKSQSGLCIKMPLPKKKVLLQFRRTVLILKSMFQSKCLLHLF